MQSYTLQTSYNWAQLHTVQPPRCNWFIVIFQVFPDEDVSSKGTTTLGEWHRDPRDQHRFPNRDGGPKIIRFESPRWRPKSSSSSSRSPGAAHTKNDAQAAYGVHFGRSIYGCKDNFKELPMTLVSGPNSFRVDENHRNKRTFRICHGAATPSFGLLVHVSCWGPLWTWLGGYARPNHHIISSLYHISVRVLFSSSFWFWNFDWFIVTVATSPFTVIQGPVLDLLHCDD